MYQTNQSPDPKFGSVRILTVWKLVILLLHYVPIGIGALDLWRWSINEIVIHFNRIFIKFISYFIYLLYFINPIRQYVVYCRYYHKLLHNMIIKSSVELLTYFSSEWKFGDNQLYPKKFEPKIFLFGRSKSSVCAALAN